MAVEEEAIARQASHEGALSRWLKRSFAVTLWLWALLMPFTLFFGESRMPLWAHVLLVIACLLLLPPAALNLWSDGGDARETGQLRRSGKPAVAEVVWMHRIAGRGYGELDTVLLRLRISGDGVPAFTAHYRGDHTPRFQVGARLDVVVDPADRLYTFVFD